MLLSDDDLAVYLKSGALVVDPLQPGAVQPCSIDLHLDVSFRVLVQHTYSHIRPTHDQPDLFQRASASMTQPFMLHPGEFVLGNTLEEVKLSSSIAAQLNGRSSLGRLGLQVHSTAGFIDPGFEGHITLELTNVTSLPIELTPGMGIGQLCVMLLTSRSVLPYGHPDRNSKYQGQQGATPSRFHENYQTPEI